MKSVLLKASKILILLILLELLWLIFTDFLPLVVHLLGIGLILILIVGLFSPFESLGWWAGWFGPPRGQDGAETSAQTQMDTPVAGADLYLVYLSGIGAISGDTLTGGEVGLLDRLSANLPNTVIVKDVFPYAMNNNGLTGQRFFAGLWDWLERRSLSGKEGLTTALTCLRNVFQVAVSGDRRYGPIYNYGVAEVIHQELLRKGYPIGSGKPVTLVGFSGGGQVSLGVSAYLKNMLEAPLYVISIGGVMSDDPGIANVEHIYHLYGTKDPIHRLGDICYAGRWPILSYSPWNQAKAAGKISKIAVGPMAHMDPHSYFDGASYLESGQSYQAHVAEVIVGLVQAQPCSLERKLV
jgi:hypothetical protein